MEKVITEKEKFDIMNKIAKNFKKYSFLESIEIIPSTYMRRNGSFNNLDQIKRLYDIDVIALILFDQTEFINETYLSFTYWTIIPATKNDMHTMLDATVYDIESRKMLFWAPGFHQGTSRSTLIGIDEEKRNNSIISFYKASDELIINMEKELEILKKKIKDNSDKYVIKRDKRYTGGSSDFMLIVIVLLLIYHLFKNRRLKRNGTVN